MKKALVLGAQVVDVCATEFEVAAPLLWVDCPDACEAYKWEYVDGTVQQKQVTPAGPVVPPSISPRQIRMALTRMSMRQAVEDAVAAGDQDLKDWWEFSTAFERSNVQVDAMRQALGVADAQVDQIWILGASL